MNEIIFKIKTSEGESFTKTLTPLNCGSSFFHFPNNPYEENPEFTNNLVLGSGGALTSQIILRVEPKGDKFNSIPHLNIDEGYIKENKEVRTRKTLEHLKFPEWVEVEMIEGDNRKFSRIELKKKNSN